MNIDHFGMDTITLAGPLEAKLRAIRDAGFTQVMLNAGDVVGHPGGEEAAVRAVRDSGLRVTGFQVLRDFEGLSGHLHAYKLDVAKAMLEMCRALGAQRPAGLLVDLGARDGRPGIAHTGSAEAGAPGGAVWHSHRLRGSLLGPARQSLTQAWEIVRDADRSNLGICIDSYHVLAHGTDPGVLDAIDPRKVFLVQLSDFLWQETRSPEDRMETARHYRVFPGEGVHSPEVVALVRQLDEMGYRGDYSFEVFNDDYRQLPLPMVAERARRSVKWITGLVSRRSLPARRTIRTVGRSSGRIPGRYRDDIRQSRDARRLHLALHAGRAPGHGRRRAGAEGRPLGRTGLSLPHRRSAARAARALHHDRRAVRRAGADP